MSTETNVLDQANQVVDLLRRLAETLDRQPSGVPISAVGTREKSRAAPVAAWLRCFGNLDLSEQDRLDLERRGWLRSTQITVPRAEVDPLKRADYAESVVPKTVADRFFEELDTYAVVRRVCTVISTDSMDRIVLPILDDRSNVGVLLTGTIDLSDTPKPTIGNLTLDCKTIHSRPVPIGRTMLRDAAIDLEGFVVNALAARIGRTLNALLTNGTGSNGQPAGVLTAAPVLATSESSSGFTWQEVYDLTMAADPVYRPRGVFMMNDALLAALYKTVDSTGQPVLWRDPVGTQPVKLFGYPVISNPDMPAEVEAGAKVILFGDFSRYCLREVNKITLKVLQETYAEHDSVGFLGLYDCDAGLAAAENTKAIGALQIAS